MPLVGVSSVNVFHSATAPSFHCHHPGAFCFLYTVVSSTKINRQPVNSVINFACNEYTLVKISNIKQNNRIYLSMQWMPVKQ